jgi:CRISPR system Cascade subunit CasD
MSVLLLRLAGPMQAWGTQSRFSVRDTDREPSKSGVVGLLCAASGIPRDDEDRIARIARLPMGVRVDREGTVAHDFHTAGGGRINHKPYGVIKASGSRGDTVVSTRHYLADADFLVGLECADTTLLDELDQALSNPVWPLFLGRKSFVPGLPVRLTVRDGELETVLRAEPWLPRSEKDEIPMRGLRLVLDTDMLDGEARYDYPICFSKSDRRYRLRHVRTTWVPFDKVRKGDVGCI